MTGPLEHLHPDLLGKLQELEHQVGHTLTITSGYRDPVKNKSVGGVEGSEHTYLPAQAVDIACTDGTQRWQIITLAIRLGFVRLGVGRDFIHLGMATDKPQHVIWHYYPPKETP